MSFDKNEITRAAELFGENNLIDILKKLLPSEQIIKFTFKINNGVIDITEVNRHHIDSIYDFLSLVMSFRIYEKVKEIRDTENGNDKDIMFPNMIIIEETNDDDIADQIYISYEENNINIYKSDGSYSRTLIPYELYKIVYYAEKRLDQKNNAKYSRGMLNLDDFKKAYPGLDGKLLTIHRDYLNMILDNKHELGIDSVFLMNDAMTLSADNADIISILVTWK